MDIPNITGFTLQSLYDKGARTITWTAYQQSLDRRVCIQLLRPEFAADPGECERFLHTARTLAKNPASTFPAIYDVVATPPPPYILLEHTNDQDLPSWVDNKGPFPPHQLLQFAQTVAQSFAVLWQATRLVHRDIKPRNIRLNDRQQPHITTFDTALCAGGPEPAPHDGQVAGTPNYLSPEQIADPNCVDCRADIYSLGATLYFLATGAEPFAELPPEKILAAQLNAQLPAPENLPPRITAILRRMMMKLPAQRYKNWDELLLDLQNALQNKPVAAPPPGAVSTLAAPAVAGAAVKPGAPAQPRAHNPVPRANSVFDEPRPSSRAGLRFILCIPLFIWFLLLANDRANDPVGIRAATGLRIPPLVRPVLNAIRGPAAKPAHPQTNTVANTESTPVEKDRDEPETKPAPPAPPVEIKPPVSTDPASNPPFARQRLLRLADAYRKNYESELHVLFQTPDPGGLPEQLAEARELHKRLPPENELLTTAIRLGKNKNHTLVHNKTERHITIMDAVDNALVLAFQADSGARKISIPFNDLDPVERFRLMLFAEDSSIEANTALARAALLHNDAAALRRLAPKCGALSPVFQHLAQE